MELITEILARVSIADGEGVLTLTRYKGDPFVKAETKPGTAGTVVFGVGGLKRAHTFLDEAFGDDR